MRRRPKGRVTQRQPCDLLWKRGLRLRIACQGRSSPNPSVLEWRWKASTYQYPQWQRRNLSTISRHHPSLSFVWLVKSFAVIRLRACFEVRRLRPVRCQSSTFQMRLVDLREQRDVRQLRSAPRRVLFSTDRSHHPQDWCSCSFVHSVTETDQVILRMWWFNRDDLFLFGPPRAELCCNLTVYEVVGHSWGRRPRGTSALRTKWVAVLASPLLPIDRVWDDL